MKSKMMRVMSYNLRYDNPADGANRWTNRKENLASQIIFHGAHVVGMQEALKNQISDLVDLLPTYKYVGVGRSDGIDSGEFCPIFYHAEYLKLVDSGTFWLSSTPEVPGSVGWDACLPRIATWAKFQLVNSGGNFLVINTHLDHRGVVAREQSSGLILQRAASLAGDEPVMLTGDFNVYPSDPCIKALIDPTDPRHFINSQSISEHEHYGPCGTFNDFKFSRVDKDPIDYIFCKGKIRVVQHATLTQSWDGRFASDHFPVFVNLELLCD